VQCVGPPLFSALRWHYGSDGGERGRALGLTAAAVLHAQGDRHGNVGCTVDCATQLKHTTNVCGWGTVCIWSIHPCPCPEEMFRECRYRCSEMQMDLCMSSWLLILLPFFAPFVALLLWYAAVGCTVDFATQQKHLKRVWLGDSVCMEHLPFSSLVVSEGTADGPAFRLVQCASFLVCTGPGVRDPGCSFVCTSARCCVLSGLCAMLAVHT
jgi:hypothetical protein